MASTIREMIENFYNWTNSPDPRSQLLPFTSLLSMIAITTVYLTILRVVPKVMANRKPFILRMPILVYNVAQMCANGFLLTNSVYELAMHPAPYYFSCAAPKTDDVYYSTIEYNSVYAYHILKIVDLLDTIFFVLRKKSNQVTFLHVYHHVAIMWGTCMIVNFSPGGHFVFLGLCNMFVHTIMYGYYFASLYQPTVKKSLVIKKLVTITQMIQFVMLVIHSGMPLLLGTPCATARGLLALCASQNVLMLILFGNFYVHKYMRHTPKVDSKKI